MDVKNCDLYNETIENSLFDVCLKVVDITNYYILYSFEGSFKDTKITQKGVDVILNVFSMILLYTKNLELAIEYTTLFIILLSMLHKFQQKILSLYSLTLP